MEREWLIIKRDVGGQKETLAVLFLEKQGFRILDRNYYTRHGELDIVAMDGEYLVFAEVKYRRIQITEHLHRQ